MHSMHEHDASAYAQALREHDPSAYATDERTNELTQMHKDSSDHSTSVTPAGGQCNFTVPGFRHDKKPHVYVVCWPAHSIVKIGMSTTVRWSAWRSRGAREIVCLDLCCMPFAHKLEQWFLKALAAEAPPAFTTKAQSRMVLGNGVGWTECYQLPRSSLFGQPSDDPYDYVRGYGIELPAELLRRIGTQRSAAWADVVPVGRVQDKAATG